MSEENEGQFREKGTGRFLKHPKPPKRTYTIDGLGVTLAAFGILLVFVLTGLIYNSTYRKLVAAQAEVERLKAQANSFHFCPATPAYESVTLPKLGEKTTARVVVRWFNGKVERMDWDGKNWIAPKPQPKPAPKRAALPKFKWDGVPSKTGIVRFADVSMCSSDMTFEQCKAVMDGTPAIELPLEPGTGPMWLENANGERHTWRRVEVPKAVRQ